MLVISRVNYTLQRCYTYECNLIHGWAIWKAIKQIFHRFESTCIINSKFYWKCETGHKGWFLLSMSCALIVLYIINRIPALIDSLYSHTSHTIRSFELNALLITFSSCSFWERTTKRQCINYRCYWICTAPYTIHVTLSNNVLCGLIFESCLSKLSGKFLGWMVSDVFVMRNRKLDLSYDLNMVHGAKINRFLIFFYNGLIFFYPLPIIL